MCIAILKPSGLNMPNEEIMYNCFQNNPHGIGIVIHRNGKNYLKKGFMKFDTFLKELKILNPKQSESVMIHFRVASVGSVRKENCHPFLVSDSYSDICSIEAKTNKCVAVHNGTFKNFKNNSNDVSDTMQLIKLISPLINKFYVFDKDVEKSLTNFFKMYVEDNNSRFAFMNSHGTIYKFGKWIKDEKTNLYFSNMSYEKVSDRFALKQLEFNI